uniref:Peptidase S1 domain-containing protein n=1 Tax=Anopheles stephensi TaxID=30069 RepID=A0A182Y9V8_ANOST
MQSFTMLLSSTLLIVVFGQIAVAQFNQCTGSDSCIVINDCALFGPYFNEPSKWSDSLRSEFRSRVCQRERTNNGNVYKVCCPRTVTYNSNRKRGIDVLDLEGCGSYSEDRIAFGQDAKLFQYPWMALLKPRVGNFVCGGTLINERYVLTAAHCLKNNDIAIVRLGEFDLGSEIDCDKRGELCALPPQDIPVERGILHESYSARRKVNDIALLRLAKDASYNDNVLPICLPVSPAMRTTQRTFFVAGWGGTESAVYSNKLQFTKLSILPNDECLQQLLKVDPYTKLNDNQMCAIGTNLTDNCTGDSGGPLKSISINARYVQYGVVSFGLRTCGRQSAPGVYTKSFTMLLSSTLLIVVFCQIAVAQFNQCKGSDSCIVINDCARFGPHFNDPSKWSVSLKNEFRSKVCKREKTNKGNVYKVCCQQSVPENNNRQRGLDLLDLESCGAYSVDKIAFGHDAKLFQYPWMALLKPRFGNFVCGGTLINERYVLTAAHCFKNNDVAIVRLGEFNLSSDIDCDKHGECAPAPQDIPIERAILHESYSARRKVNDIALIRLAQKASYNDNVQPICLPATPAMRTKQTVYFVAGWGRTETALYSDKLQYTMLNILPNEQCSQQLLKVDPYTKIYDSQMCAIGRNLTDNCTGDSGGPLKAVSINARFVQYGVVSVGLRSCGRQSAPGVYTRVESARILSRLVVFVAYCQTVTALNEILCPTEFNACYGSEMCINIRDCDRFSPHHSEPGKWSASLRNEFRQRVCQREKNNGISIFKVCCDVPAVQADDEGARKRGLELLDLERCGSYTDDKISFGQDAKLFQFPWMALLRGKVGSFFCGGTLINDRYVLTAAHCIVNNDVSFVRLGEYDLNSTIDCDKHGECAMPPQDIPVERTFSHQDYSGRFKMNDIGLIRLARRVALNDNVLPICLPVTPAFGTKQTTFFVVGWGQTQNALFSNKLQYTKLSLVANDECQKQLRQKDKFVRIFDSQLCAIGADLSDNCSGDSGGPLKSISVQHSRYVQYGVVSFGLRTCGKQSAPGVYTKVENYIDWILSRMEE